MAAATASRGTAELLGFGPYFERPLGIEPPKYAEWRLGDYQHELGLIDLQGSLARGFGEHLSTFSGTGDSEAKMLSTDSIVVWAGFCFAWREVRHELLARLRGRSSIRDRANVGGANHVRCE